MISALRGHRLGAALGVLALALIVLAPLFSQSRAESQDWSWLTELACHEGLAQAASPAMPDDLPQKFKLDACGYCSLLINSPALGSLDWGYFNIAVMRLGPQSLRWLWPALAMRFPAAQSRAPPVALD